MDLNYWEDYYRKHPDAFEPSDFAQFVAKYVTRLDHIIDLGCGNARDTLFFSQLPLMATGIDQCTEEIERLKIKYTTGAIKFQNGNFDEIKDDFYVDHAYSRFTLHSITEESEDSVISWASKCVNKYFFIETRSDKDKLNGVTTDHYRRFINMNELLVKLIRVGFAIEYAELSRNFSKYSAKYNVDYNEDDPMLIRVVARKL